ncbi:MAG: hypothetical protein J0I49_17310 [Pseudonocardia sp.]|nr:hypothetical protein [Pseudonocardia sp.]OJY43970.1 MAG: hypothetical protein BGP03_06575 [Pseudonocardia sp. 73-21]
MKIMAALLRDPNMIHLDAGETARLGLGDRVVNQGPINLGYVHTMLAAWAGGEDRVLATAFRFRATVLAGDRVVAGGRVTAVHDDGRVECEVWLDVEGRGRAVSGTAVVGVRRRSA